MMEEERKENIINKINKVEKDIHEERENIEEIKREEKKLKSIKDRILEEQRRIKELEGKRENLEKQEKEEERKLKKEEEKFFDIKGKVEKDKYKETAVEDSKEDNLDSQKIFNFFKSKKGQWILISIALLMIIVLGSWIRVQNLPLLVDETTGKNIPVALDPYYFLRIAETIVENGGELPAYDEMRVLHKPVPWLNEILPWTIVGMWKISNVFGDYSIQYIDVISPVIFFALGVFIFFFLILSLTNSKSIAIISSLFLAVTPAYLYRTMAGFADHEAIGMVGFFLALLVYSYSLKFLDKSEKFSKDFLYKSILTGLMVGLATAFTQASWGGLVRFVYLVIPLSFIMFWLLKTKGGDYNKIYPGYALFYVAWLFASFTAPFIFGYDIFTTINTYLISTSGIAGLFVLGFVVVDLFYLKILKKYIPKKYWKFRIYINILITFILGLLFLVIAGKDLISLISDVFRKFHSPFAEAAGIGRLGLTVAENKQPYLMDWIGQTGKILFYFFVSGMFFVGFNAMRKIRKNKDKLLFVGAWFLFVFGFLFSRISANSSIMNGESLLSNLVYFGSFLFLVYAFFVVYSRENISIDSNLLIILSWLVLMLVAGRGAIRLFFMITPFMMFMVGYSIVNLFDYAKKSKEDIIRISFFILFGIGIILLIISFSGQFANAKNQAMYTGPSANSQWQQAMEWVRLNTPEGSIFSHWWDYGYWVEYLGKRPTIADGGHFEGIFRDHMIGRYILTNSNPDSALSFLKSNNISYLLIDQSDIGKYPAYATIGSDREWDRVSNINTMISNPKNIKETSTGQVRIYEGVRGVEDDIVYEKNGTEMFFPGAVYDDYGAPNYKSYVAGFELEIFNSMNKSGFGQPTGIFFYKNERYNLPLRYVYFNGEIYDFEQGIESVIYVFPSVIQTNTGQQIDSFGAAMYLSKRTMDSLMAQLFLMEDAFERYNSSMTLVHTESHPIIKNLKTNGWAGGEFIYYQGVQGPIKIWEVNAPEEILINEEFTRTKMNFAEFDDLVVRK